MATTAKPGVDNKGASTSITNQKELISAVVASGVAGLVMAFVANAAKPSLIHDVLVLAVVAAIVWAYLQIAKSAAEAQLKAGAVIVAAIVGVVLLKLASMVL